MDKKNAILGSCILTLVCGVLFFKPIKDKLDAIQRQTPIPIKTTSIDVDAVVPTLDQKPPSGIDPIQEKVVEQLVNAGDYDAALLKIDQQLKIYPENSQKLLFLKGKVLEAKGDFNDSEDIFLKIIENDPENYEALVHVGYAAMLSQDIQKAVLYTNKALDIQPDFPEGMFLKAQLFMTLNDVQGALTFLDNALMYAPDNIDYHFFKYKVFENIKQVEASLSVLRDIIRIDPQNKDAHLLLIGTLQQNNRFEEAQEAINGLKLIYPENVTYQIMSALNLETLGKISESESVYRKTITKNPDNVEVLMHLGKFFLRKMHYRKAISILNIAVSKTNKIDLKSNIYGDISFAEFKSGKLPRAKDAMDKALSLDDQQPHALLSKAKFMMQNGEFAEAKAILMNLLQTNEWPDIYYNLAVAKENLDEGSKSVDELVNKALALSPGDPEFLMFSAERDLRANNEANAKEKLKKVMSITGHNKHQYAHLIASSDKSVGELRNR